MIHILYIEINHVGTLSITVSYRYKEFLSS